MYVFCSAVLLGIQIFSAAGPGFFFLTHCWAPSHYTSLFPSLSNLKTLWVKGNRNRANHKGFQSAFQQNENSASTEDAKAPIKTVFVH